MSDTAESLGARLRAERERKGLSAQKAADDLHLDGWIIDALESDDYARIGPSVYGKGHLKRYAEKLGLPVNDIMAAYDGRSASPAVVAGAQASTLRMRASDADDRELPWALIGGAAAVVLVAAAVFWWKPWNPRVSSTPAVAAAVPGSGENAGLADSQPNVAMEPSTSDADDQPSTDAVVGLPPTRDVAGAASRKGTASGASAVAPGGSAVTARVAAATAAVTNAPAAAGTAMSAAGATTSAPGAAGEGEPGAGKARLRLSFSADSWVDVHDAAGHRLFAGSGRANSVKTIAGDAPLKVYLGFAIGVQVEVNSRVVAIGPQFVTGDKAHFDAGADGVLRRDSQASVAAANARPHG